MPSESLFSGTDFIRETGAPRQGAMQITSQACPEQSWANHALRRAHSQNGLFLRIHHRVVSTSPPRRQCAPRLGLRACEWGLLPAEQGSLSPWRLCPQEHIGSRDTFTLGTRNREVEMPGDHFLRQFCGEGVHEPQATFGSRSVKTNLGFQGDSILLSLKSRAPHPGR